MDGLQCSREIRTLQREGKITRHIEIIATTANAREEQIEMAIASGCVSFFLSLSSLWHDVMWLAIGQLTERRSFADKKLIGLCDEQTVHGQGSVSQDSREAFEGCGEDECVKIDNGSLLIREEEEVGDFLIG